MTIHIIACGGAVMHNLTIALHLNGMNITTSDDEIFEPAKSRLEKYKLLPASMGWNTANINANLDAVIVGMHARKDNPELIEAQRIGLKIYSFPEYIFEQSKTKKRVVIAGSHGKTTITSMVMHVLKANGINFDYMVGSIIEGFETMVKLSKDAKIIILEGDEYSSSPIDPRPKFLLYKADIALISGIAWDHINVFPTFEYYTQQFVNFINTLPNQAPLIYFMGDDVLHETIEKANPNLQYIPYTTHINKIENGISYLKNHNDEWIRLQIFGDHNLANLNGAKLICNEIGISNAQFYDTIGEFKGAAKRLDTLFETDSSICFRDFAHAPSKLKATTDAVKKQYPDRKLIATMELHTFSSLDKQFLPQYHNTMNAADEAIVYFNPEVVKHKRLEPITEQDIINNFNKKDLKVFTDSSKLLEYLQSKSLENTNLLLMSSGNYNNIDFKCLNQNNTSQCPI